MGWALQGPCRGSDCRRWKSHWRSPFNIGVELGQIAFIAVVFLAIITLKRTHDVQRDWPIAARKIPAYAIGAVSAFWLIDRFWGFAA